MDRELRNKLDELTRSIDELCEQFGITKDMIPDIDDEDMMTMMKITRTRIMKMTMITRI